MDIDGMGGGLRIPAWHDVLLLDHHRVASSAFLEIGSFFRAALDEAIADGELRDGTDIDMWADSLTVTVVSLMTLGRAEADESAIRNVQKPRLKVFRDHNERIQTGRVGEL